MKTAPSGFKIRKYYVVKISRNKDGLLYKPENHASCGLLSYFHGYLAQPEIWMMKILFTERNFILALQL